MEVMKSVAFFMATFEQNDLTLTYKISVYSKADPPKSIQSRKELALQAGAGLGFVCVKKIFQGHLLSPKNTARTTNVSGLQ